MPLTQRARAFWEKLGRILDRLHTGSRGKKKEGKKKKKKEKRKEGERK